MTKVSIAGFFMILLGACLYILTLLGGWGIWWATFGAVIAVAGIVCFLFDDAL